MTPVKAASQNSGILDEMSVCELAGSVEAPAMASRRLERQWRTMAAMVRIYCTGVHGQSEVLCPECRELLDYATVRLKRCRFGPQKPTCANCPVHCYAPAPKASMKVVMRYAGPRMLWRHPLLSLCHWVDGFRSAPALR